MWSIWSSSLWCLQQSVILLHWTWCLREWIAGVILLWLSPRPPSSSQKVPCMGSCIPLFTTSLSCSFLPSLPYRNTNTSDYDLNYRVRVRIPPGDTATTALVLAGSTPTLNLTATTPFVTRGNISVVVGSFKRLSTLKTEDGQTYLDVVKAMIASPGKYIAQIASIRMSAGIAGGMFVTRTLPGLVVTRGTVSGSNNIRGVINRRGHWS